MIPHILLCNDGSGPQSKSLVTALQRRGAVVSQVALAAIAFDSRAPHGLAVPGFAQGLPDAVLVRSVSAGSFEAVTRRLGVLHAFGKLGVPVWNSAQAIERCVDKSMTSFLLKNAGLPTPATFAVESIEAAYAVAERELHHSPLVLKPLFGAQGRGIRMIESLADLPPAEEVDNVFYLQHYIHRSGPPFHDFRVFVCAGKAVAMMRRRGQQWVTNVTRGGIPEALAADARPDLAGLAIAAADAVGADFAGVDLVEDREGNLMVLEVNSMPAWSGLQTVSPVHISAAIAEALLGFLASRRAKPGEPPIRFVSPANSSA